MKVRILRQPSGTIQGISLQRYRPGQVYDVPATLAAYLVTEGLGIVEMRADQPLQQPAILDRRRNTASRGES
jgi:hypothetical protein